MSLSLPVLVVGIAAALQAQPPTIDRLRALTQEIESTARERDADVAQAVREHPDDARELIRRQLAEAGRTRAAASDSILRQAGHLARAYARVWQDSFPLIQVAQFAAMSAGERDAKLAADSVRRAGNVALGRSGVDAALRLWREALRRSSAIADSAGIAAALGNIGAGLYRRAELDSAELYLGRARQIAAAIGDRRTAGNAVGTLGDIARDRGNLRRARSLYDHVLDLRSRIGDVRGAAAAQNNLGLLAADLGELNEARRHYRQALALARQHKLDEPAAAALINIGNAASMEADYAAAARSYGEALSIYRSARSHADAALVLHNLGLLALRRGDYATATSRLNEALALFSRTGTTEDLVLVRRDLASVAAAAGDLRGAMAALRMAERLAARPPVDHELAAEVALARGDLASQLNNQGEAAQHFARAEAFFRRAGNSVGRAEAQQGQALLLLDRRQYLRAIELLRSAARTHTASGDRRSAAVAQLNIGHALHRQGELDAARRAIAQAAESLQALRDPVAAAAALAAAGDVELESGAALAAERLYRHGLALMRTQPAATVSWQLRAGLGRSLAARGALADAEAEFALAIADVEHVAGTLTVEERRATFLADKWDVYAQLVAVQHTRGDASSAFVTSEKMRAQQMLDILARGRVSRPAATDSSLGEREQDLRRRIGELAQRVGEGGNETTERRGHDPANGPHPALAVTREALGQAQAEYAQLLLDLRDEDSEHSRVVRGEVASWREVASRLAPQEALLEYLVTDSTTVVFIVRRDTLHLIDLDIGRGALEPLVDFARGTIEGRRPGAAERSSRAWQAPFRRLHQHLVAPVEDAGALAGATRLIIIPHAELHYLPFAALLGRNDLPRNQRDAFLIERYEIGYAPSASVWVRLAERSARRAAQREPSDLDAVLALAPRTGALPGSREEIDAIRRLYGRHAHVLTNAASSESAFLEAVARFPIVHLATYGVLNKHNPLFSFVTLAPGAGADGRLEVHEVFGLQLNARLLVLSACQTALGAGSVSDVPPGDDWVGLVRAFLGAGAQNVIATLWPVEDRSTARLMERLYRRLRSGEPEISALAGAQRESLRVAATAHPFYWAGFVLVGAP